MSGIWGACPNPAKVLRGVRSISPYAPVAPVQSEELHGGWKAKTESISAESDELVLKAAEQCSAAFFERKIVWQRKT